MPIIKTKELFTPLLALIDDLDRAEKDLDANEDAYSRRNYVRALFALIDGTIYILKQTILVAASDDSRQLSIGEHALLREESFDLTENGDVRSHKKFPTLAANLLFTKHQLEKHFDYALNIDVKSTHWSDFKRAIEIRHRVTHPKKMAEFDLSKDEVVLAKRVGHWFGTFMVEWTQQFVATAKPLHKSDTDKTIDYPM
jgi:hypothetical protein